MCTGVQSAKWFLRKHLDVLTWIAQIVITNGAGSAAQIEKVKLMHI